MSKELSLFQFLQNVKEYSMTLFLMPSLLSLKCKSCLKETKTIIVTHETFRINNNDIIYNSYYIALDIPSTFEDV